MTADPRISFWLSVSLAVFAFMSTAGSQLVDLGFSPQTVKAILAFNVLLLGLGNAVNAVLAAIPSKPGDTSKFYLGPKGPTP